MEEKTHKMRNANHMSSYGGSSSPSQAKQRRTSKCFAARRTADDTAYASGSALRPHLDDAPPPGESGLTLSERTCRARSGRV